MTTRYRKGCRVIVGDEVLRFVKRDGRQLILANEDGSEVYVDAKDVRTFDFTVKFWGCKDTFKLRDVEASDGEIERVRLVAEKKLGRKLPLDPGTEFPSFTIWENGEEWGAG